MNIRKDIMRDVGAIAHNRAPGGPYEALAILWNLLPLHQSIEIP